MTPDEIAKWKAERAKRPLAERLADVAGHRVEAATQADSSEREPNAEVSFADVQRMREPSKTLSSYQVATARRLRQFVQERPLPEAHNYRNQTRRRQAQFFDGSLPNQGS
jgi:hypothetical protein